ncbi:hypothetical protein BGZ65_008904 [Modicella reniformis]|uniref:Uncharacterized protein n=1 Tax=Modicella reniformis TaxID=1440133 RepID=A0A9P6MM00_9FUNG|nr:hypothetical protein BGZ65_008904 [Modicella reniformis]
MANPSTQPPSNATTTDIIFARDFVPSSYMLLEVPKCLADYINGQSEDGILSFQVRGIGKDTAVLCTPTQTFSLQRAHTSNMLIPIAPVVGRRKQGMDTDAEMNTDMDVEADPYDIQGQESDGSRYEKQAVLDILDSVLDLNMISPRLDRLAELLAQSQFEGWAQEAEVKVFKITPMAAFATVRSYPRLLERLSTRMFDLTFLVSSQGHLYAWTQLQSIIQASDKEILQWLKDRHACLIKGLVTPS